MAIAGRVVDLSQPLGRSAVHWPGTEPLAATTVSSIAYARRIDTPEHAATHLDAPGHFVPDGVTTDAIQAERLVVDGALLDVADRCAQDSDFALGALRLAEGSGTPARVLAVVPD